MAWNPRRTMKPSEAHTMDGKVLLNDPGDPGALLRFIGYESSLSSGGTLGVQLAAPGGGSTTAG